MTRIRPLPWHLALLCSHSRSLAWALAAKGVRVSISGRTAFWYD